MGVRKATSTAPKKKPEAKRSKRRRPTLTEEIIAIGMQVPDDELEKLPRDGAENLDHYLYGAPKRY
jgi:hypothetical protein